MIPRSESKRWNELFWEDKAVIVLFSKIINKCLSRDKINILRKVGKIAKFLFIYLKLQKEL